MTTGSLPRRYARALLGHALAHSLDLEKLDRELEGLADLLREGQPLRLFIANPLVPQKQKATAFARVVEQARFSKDARNFLRLLEDKGRLLLLPEIMVAFRNLADTRQGIVRGEVVSAAPLAERTLHSLTTALGKAMSKKVILSVRTDPSIIGGLIVKVGSLNFDGSLRAQMSRIRETLSAEVNP